MRNKVYLVGAGPGDPELLTIQALKVLKRADVVLYDKLVARKILRLLGAETRKVYVGRGKECAEERQDRIYELILKYHKQGKKIVRLQSGDPLLLGRGGEEIQFLKKQGIEYEIVPGITSAIGVPSRAGLPLTQRNVSSSLMIVSGHLMEGKEVDWKQAAAFPGTVVVLMGARNIDQICKKLIQEGKRPETPACMIMKGTLRAEKIIAGRLDKLADLAVEKKISAPVITVIGDVVRLTGFYHE